MNSGESRCTKPARYSIGSPAAGFGRAGDPAPRGTRRIREARAQTTPTSIRERPEEEHATHVAPGR